jgi:D-alanyl-D-alanine carboxypeptidase (penicillin-binding protein 5/6)
VKVGSKSDLYVTVPKGQGDRLKAELLSQQPLLAPLTEGQHVGTLRVLLDDNPVGEFPLVTLEPVAQAGLLGRLWDTLRLWVK